MNQYDGLLAQMQNVFNHAPNCFCQFCAARLPTPSAPAKMTREDLGIVDQNLDDKVGMDEDSFERMSGHPDLGRYAGKLRRRPRFKVGMEP